MRDSITYYQVLLAKPWTSNAPGNARAEVGAVLYHGEGKPPEADSRSAGLTPEGSVPSGWYRVIGHGLGETIPTTHLRFVQHVFTRTSSNDLTLDEMVSEG